MPKLWQAEMLVLASPVFYHDLSAQLRCVIDRLYAVGYPRRAEKTSQGRPCCSAPAIPDVYDGILYTYQRNFIDYMGLENKGILTIPGYVDDAALERARALGASV